MTAPAPAQSYDLKEERPVRTAIDPIRTIDAIRHGFRICVASGYDSAEATLPKIVWALFVEAARVERAMSTPRGRGYGNGWPEIVYSAADHFAARASRLESQMPEYEITQSRDCPTAAQISRYDEVSVWLRFCHGEDKILLRDVLWGKAGGRPWPVLASQTGLSIKRCKNIKAEQLNEIAKRLKHELHGFDLRSALTA